MTTILFVMRYPLHRGENLKIKFDGQIAGARALGLKPYWIGWDDTALWLMGGDTPVRLLGTGCTRLPAYEHTLFYVKLMQAVRLACQRQRFDLMYLRYMPTFHGALTALRTFKQTGGRLILEFPTWPRDQENNRFFLRRQVFRYTDHILQQITPMVDLFTAIGEPCGNPLYGRPAMNIVNGADVSSLPLHQPRSQSEEIHLLALASMSGWHGYDRILHSLAAYRGDARVHIDFVGGDGDGSLAAWKTLAEELGLTEQVTFHGACYGAALEAIFTQSDVGVGSLGMFRYGLQHATTLKLREYMARGLPFLYATEDPSLPDEPDFALRVSNDEQPILMEDVVRFARNVQQNPEIAQRMRRYAEDHMSWKSVLKAVLERLENA